ncbi:MAG TPA: nucleotide-binding protein [Nitrososphaeraceae archaeon]|nr:nucleotide-binding protein [Nitrososphaeraceae archaeon]
MKIEKTNGEIVYILDLAEDRVKELAARINDHKNVLLGGITVSSYDILKVKISGTGDRSDVIIKKRRDREGFFRMPGGKDNYIFEQGIDLTSNYIIEHSSLIKDNQPDIQDRQPDIFIVHGHEEIPLNELYVFLYDLGFKPISLGKLPEEGNTVIEKFETYASTIKYVFVILTPDDVGGERPAEGVTPTLKPRARQNVILELGYFYARLGRKNVCCISKGDIERPSDLAGILFIDISEGLERTKFRIQDELIKAKRLRKPLPL